MAGNSSGNENVSFSAPGGEGGSPLTLAGQLHFIFSTHLQNRERLLPNYTPLERSDAHRGIFSLPGNQRVMIRDQKE